MKQSVVLALIFLIALPITRLTKDY